MTCVTFGTSEASLAASLRVASESTLPVSVTTPAFELYFTESAT